VGVRVRVRVRERERVRVRVRVRVVKRRGARVAWLVEVTATLYQETNRADVALQGGRAERREAAVQELLVQGGRAWLGLG